MKSTRRSQLPLYVWPFCYDPRSIYAIPLIPVRGFVHFIMTPALWDTLLSVMAPQLLLTLLLFVCLYFIFFTIQIFWSIGIMCIGPMAPLILFLNFLHQVDAVAQRIGAVFFYELPLESLFDFIYATQSHGEDAIIRAKTGRKKPQGNLIESLTLWMFEFPRILVTWPTDQLVVILTIWMMAIPGIGPLITVLIEAPKKGRAMHERYFALKGLSLREIEIYHDDMWWHYYVLGFMTGFLETIPFVSTLFVFTNRTGAAMWSVDLENAYLESSRGREWFQEATSS